MAKGFEYQVCHSQFDRVTFVNEVWQGAVDPESVGALDAAGTCPRVCDYLKQVGGEGWELIAVVAQTVDDQNQQVLYLKRRLE